MASIDGGFYCASDYTLIVGVPRAAVAIYLHYYTRGGGGLTGRIGRKRRNTSAAARRTPSPGAPIDGGIICASADTLFDCISRSVLSIFQFFTPNWRGDSAAARVPSPPTRSPASTMDFLATQGASRNANGGIYVNGAAYGREKRIEVGNASTCVAWTNKFLCVDATAKAASLHRMR